MSKIKPSPELLKASVGVYQIDQGPTIKVTLDGETLKGAQMPNEQFQVVLVPTAETEFFVTEINGAFGFEKDPVTNTYAVAMFQNGQKFMAKKVQ